MSLWFRETEADSVEFGVRIEDVLFSGDSDFQKVEVVQTVAYGKMLVLDGCVMVTERDEFVYHEMIAHIPATLHPNPKKVVVIGGGDGGTVRELLKHPSIESIILCEIDQMVIDASHKFFPQLASSLHDKRVEVKVGDGIAYVKELCNEVDIMIIDSTDPIGPGEGLFTGAFYQSVHKALKADGIMVAQSESPWFRPELLGRITKNIKSAFPHLVPYIGSIPTYPRGLWSWTLAAKNPISRGNLDMARFSKIAPTLQYLSEEMVSAVFALPPFYRKKLDL